MKINPVNGGGIMPSKQSQRVEPVSPPTNEKTPTEAIKTNHCGGQNASVEQSNLSTEDLVKLIMAMEAMKTANEITEKVIQKYLGSSD